jgi:hypothetical protein
MQCVIFKPLELDGSDELRSFAERGVGGHGDLKDGL